MQFHCANIKRQRLHILHLRTSSNSELSLLHEYVMF